MIPRHFHFIFGLKPQPDPLHIMHYLCLKSCIEINQPDRITLYYHYEPHGPWWERIRPSLELVHVPLETFITRTDAYNDHEEGEFIRRRSLDYAHQSDFIRLRALIEHGGVYADMDTLFVKPLPKAFFEFEFAMGLESAEGDEENRSLCNAMMLSRKGASFPQRWLDRMYVAFDGSWSRHSNGEATALAEQYPAEITALPQRHFYRYPYTGEGINTLFMKLDQDLKDVYSLHLWEHLWWDRDRLDFSPFHAGILTEDFIRRIDTTYNVIARQYLPD